MMMDDVKYEEMIKTEPEVIGGTWVHQSMEGLLQNEYKDRNLELGNAVGKLPNENSGEVCENCKMEYKDYCMNCGHVNYILDNKTQVGIYGRAMWSIPTNILRIKGNLMEGYGVYALRNIPKGVKFGPYEGLEKVGNRNNCLWKIRYSKLMQANGDDNCNWIRFINRTLTQSEQNLIALQSMEKIYYKTSREIKIGEELLIYYGNNYSDDLGLIQYFQPEVEEFNENIFKCLPCCFGFSEEKFLVHHNRVCPYKKEIAFEVDCSTDIKDVEGHPKICEALYNLSANHQQNNENGKMLDNVGLHREEEVLEQDVKVVGHMELIKKEIEEKIKSSHCNNDDLSTGALFFRAPVLKVTSHQNKCYEIDLNSNHLKGKKQSSECNSLKKYKCQECPYAVARKDNLLCHIQSHHTMEKPYQCNECSYAAVRKNYLLSHVKQHHTMERPYKCNECSFATVLKSKLQYHIKCYHTMEKPYKCNECSYAAIEKFKLLAHIRSNHTMEKPYTCNECSYAAVYKHSLMSHIKHHHTMEKPYKCNKCSYAAVQKYDLASHIKRRHTKEKTFKCNDCSYTAVAKADLLSHIKYCHIMEKPYKCNECSYAAERKGHLVSHIRQHHTMEKPYKCNECSFATVRKPTLIRHIQAHHSMEKPYQCNDCSYTSSGKTNLKNHIKSRHTMERPYKCNECSYAAMRRSTLLFHITCQHTAEKPLALIMQ